ncbi:MAG: Snf7 family protein [Aeropyrum sp.]|nr:Snf7 family protein [Aeropyrum sp.]MCE4615974.1 Snf7 family protein [Aeropyrum sp.]
MGLESWARKWSPPENVETVGQKIKNFISPPPPVRSQIIQAVYRIQGQISKLDYSLAKLQSYDKMLFEKVVNSLVEGDKSKATMYANELAEVRKMAKVIITVRYALERVRLRLETALVFGDVNATLAPAIVALKQVAGHLKGMMPDVFTELMEVDESLQAAMMQMTAHVPVAFDNAFVSEEANKILKDASIVAEQRLKEHFPDLPSFEKAAQASEKASEGNGK